MTPFHVEPLASGLAIEFFDCSNRYFGAYWRLCLDVRCRIEIAGQLSGEELEKARATLGEFVEFTRRLERMGVAEEELAIVRQQLVDSFLASTRGYLEQPDFPARLIANRLTEKKRMRSLPVRHGN